MFNLKKLLDNLFCRTDEAKSDADIFSEFPYLSITMNHILEDVFQPIFGNDTVSETSKMGILVRHGGSIELRNEEGHDLLNEDDISPMEDKRVEITFRVID